MAPSSKTASRAFRSSGPRRGRRTDGYIWGMIRNGRGLMPTYNRIEELDRWDVVNYVRGLQGSCRRSSRRTRCTVVPARPAPSRTTAASRSGADAAGAVYRRGAATGRAAGGHVPAPQAPA